MPEGTTFVLAVGTPWDGITLYGPFDSTEEAEEAFMNDERIGSDYWEIIPVEPSPAPRGE